MEKLLQVAVPVLAAPWFIWRRPLRFNHCNWARMTSYAPLGCDEYADCLQRLATMLSGRP